MKKIISILFLLTLATPAFAHFDESSIILYDVDEYEAKWQQLRKEYYYKVEHNLPCGSYENEVEAKFYSWLSNEQAQGRQLQGVEPNIRHYYVNDHCPRKQH